ncbi:MAG TPA: carboxypeptidase-like regulatory domain-containing protein, partial [Terriglobales bacterium]|nr:carboxypeptidase-like regulatory domain-containing protein [Terriglobales bacterium]
MVVKKIFLFAIAILLTSPAWAQFTSNVQGVVQDSSGAVISKATVTLTNQATQASRSTTSDADGNFRFVSLAPGSYKLAVEA